MYKRQEQLSTWHEGIFLIDMQIIKFTDKDDEENRMSKIFETYKLILIRPDRYVYGGIESLDDSSDIIESLESTFSLKI